MIILEFSDVMVDFFKRVPAKVCVIRDIPDVTALRQSPEYMRYVQLANKVYSISGTRARVIKDRYGATADFEISGEDAVALVLKAPVL